jgi:toxin HigB-1
MRYDIADKDLKRLYTDPGFTGGFPPEVVCQFRKRMQQIINAQDVRDLYQLTSLHFEKLKGKRKHQHSMRLNDQFRLVLRIRGKGEAATLVIEAIEDYH